MSEAHELAELFPSEDRFLRLLNAIEDHAIYMLDPDGHVLTWNRGAELNKGYTESEILGHPFRAFFVPADVEAKVPERELEQARQQGRVAGEGWRLRKNGERFWVGYTITAMRDEAGRLIGFAKVVRDLSERKQHLDAMVDMEQRLRIERNRLAAAADSSLDAFYICDAVRNAQGDIEDFVFTYLNANVEKMVRIPREQLLGQRMCVMLPINVTLGLFDRYKEVVRSGQPLLEEFAVADERVLSSWIRLQVVKLGDGIAITASDVTERKRQEAQLAETAAFLQSTLASSPLGIFTTALDGRITSFNRAAERMLWYRSEALLGEETPLLFFDRDALHQRAESLRSQMHVAIVDDFEVLIARSKLGFVEETEWQIIRKDGSRFEAGIVVSTLNGPDGEILGYVFVVSDISERKRTHEYISHLAHHDALTHLPTRMLLLDRLTMAINRANRAKTITGLMMIDLDHFKRVNDLLGHHSGDRLLVVTADRLRAHVRVTDTVARMGGDEFVILLDEVSSVEEAEKIATKLIEAIAQPVTLGDRDITPTASIGICTYPDNASGAEAMLRNADTAMYQAKSAGKNTWRTFDATLREAALWTRSVEANLSHGLAHREFELAYQPQVNLESGVVTGLEALLRWNSPKLGVVMPKDFVRIAESSGLIVPLGEWALRTACKQAKRLQEQLGRKLTIAVNVSPRQFQDNGFPDTLASILRESGLDPASLELEITENILVDDAPDPLRVLERIRDLGVHLVIDDFGTGFSSMAYILRFRVDRVKIDKSFVREMTSNSDNHAITSAVIAMCKSLRIPTIAEGIETEDHRNLLRREGCESGQGYFYAKPLAFSEVAKAIEELED